MERLQKALASAGVCSRRKAETLILAGRVRVDGRVVNELGSQVDPQRQRIEVDGKRVTMQQPMYVVMHKPRAMVTTLDDPEGRATVGEILAAVKTRLFPVGRLDYHTSGVLLATNDGALSEALLRPGRGVQKIYVAKVRGSLDENDIKQLRDGVAFEDGTFTAPAEVFVEREERGNIWVRLHLEEGKNRQVHRMFEGIGRHVQRLVRLSFAGITCDGLRPGEWRFLEHGEVEKLQRLAGTQQRPRRDRGR